MGVQYRGSVVARGDAPRFSVNSSCHQREADVVLRPCKEGVGFTVRLLGANRMAKVVEIHCHDATDEKEGDGEEKKKDAKKHHELTDEDIDKLFEALGSDNENGEEDEDGDLEDVDITDEYQAPVSQSIVQSDGGGLPHLESLSIICTCPTPSFIAAITAFLSSSGSFPRFTRLAIQGVNLRGSVLELRAFAEALRLHPHIQQVKMTGCFFNAEQQADMGALQKVFEEQERKQRRSSSVNSQPEHARKLLFQTHKDGTAWNPEEPAPANQLRASTTKIDPPTPMVIAPDDDDDDGQELKQKGSWWGEKLVKFCFCGLC